MKKIGIILIAIIAVLSFNSCTDQNIKENKVKKEDKILSANFDWLLGNWIRNNEEEGKQTFEIWEKVSNYEYSGIGFTMQGNDTLKQEKIKLIKKDGKWVLKVQPQDEPAPITFMVTNFNEQEFICENKELDFPKLIKYWKNGKKINALVSGDNLELLFEFKRISEKETM